MYAYYDHILSINQCCFQLVYIAETCSIVIIKKWKKSIVNGRVNEAVMSNLSKAFDSIRHNLIIAKLAAFRFDYDSLSLVNSCLKGRKQRSKIKNFCSSYSVIMCDVPQG